MLSNFWECTKDRIGAFSSIQGVDRYPFTEMDGIPAGQQPVAAGNNRKCCGSTADFSVLEHKSLASGERVPKGNDV
ncbi:MAG: hypothetical protein R6V72_06925 [Cyclobacterium sp.]|uniref:hypothetical protein n=1 Tax=Cyclobacterium sp. TaxID=1966343 RepID=UPI0039707378